MQTVAILFTVFNRREITLDCLRLCYAEIESAKAEGRYSFSIYLTDDGSTDGLSEAVMNNFPDVHIINGDGTLFWNRGMIAAWDEAAEENYDFYLWMNNDTMPSIGSFAVLLENSFYLGHRAIVVGTAEDSSGVLSYGGRTRGGKLIQPDPEIPVACDIFNGNMVLVPRSVYEVLGTMEPKYSHSFGDFDYGIRAMKDDITAVVAPGVLATCDRNPGIPKWRDPEFPLRERYKALLSPKGRPFGEQFLYDVRKSGILYAAGHFLSINAKVIFPQRRKQQ
ncbi:MAG: glycosyltransferase [Bacteroidales bacterium]|nr:glycosyltransferase [Bacteroides sp.]MCM1197539.1 glycosyltransferase [Clostridium sp.]MCM1502246.1 glycosyltransferase [Bacteroidales bacterium]